MEKFRLVLRKLTIIATCFFIGFCIAKYIHNDFKPTITEKHCGTIVSKSNDEVAIKHGTQTQLFLNIEFDKKGFESVQVLPTTYFKHKVGERVCIDFQHNDGIIATGFISFWILIVCILYFFFVWVFFGEFWKWK